MNKCCEHDKENKKALQAMDLVTGMAQKDKEIESAFCEGAEFERQALMEKIEYIVDVWCVENIGSKLTLKQTDELKQKLKKVV